MTKLKFTMADKFKMADKKKTDLNQTFIIQYCLIFSYTDIELKQHFISPFSIRLVFFDVCQNRSSTWPTNL